MAPKQMKAKYASVCPLCNNKIQVNDDVMWEKDKSATHLPGKCPPKIEAKKKGTFFGRPTQDEIMADDFARIMVRELVAKHGLPIEPEKSAGVIYRMVRALMVERKKK